MSSIAKLKAQASLLREDMADLGGWEPCGTSMNGRILKFVRKGSVKVTPDLHLEMIKCEITDEWENTEWCKTCQYAYRGECIY